MTLFDGLRGVCFLFPVMMGVTVAGRSAWAVGIIVGLLAGGLGVYAFTLTSDYLGRFYERYKPGIVYSILDLAYFTSAGIVILTTSGLAVFMTGFIIRYVAP